MGLLITTDHYGVKVFRSDKYGFPQYAIGVRDAEKSVTEWITVRFRKGVELQNGDEIHITDAFPTVNKWTSKDGQEHHKLVIQVLDFRYADKDRHAAPAPPKTRPEKIAEAMPADVGDSFSTVYDDIPF